MNQCQNPLERGTRLKPDGYGLGQAVSGPLCGRGTRPRRTSVTRAVGVCDACPRERHGRPAGEELGVDPVK